MRLWTIFVVLLCTGGAMGVTPASWDHTTESDFAKGKSESTVVSSLGEVRLGRKIDILVPTESAPAVVSAVVRVGKTIYAADGTEAVIHRIRGDKVDKFAELPGTMVTTLIAADGNLLVGVGGDEAGIYSVDAKGKVRKLWTDPDVKYVWAIVPGPGGRLYAATGPQGKVFVVSTIDDPVKSEVLYEAGKLAKNILSLTRSKDGLLYAGTDKNGLVVEIDPRKKTSRVILDADEKEIAVLLVDESGAVYAATSDTAKAGADGRAKPNSVKAGKAARTATTKPSPVSAPPADADAPKKDDAEPAPATAPTETKDETPEPTIDPNDVAHAQSRPSAEKRALTQYPDTAPADEPDDVSEEKPDDTAPPKRTKPTASAPAEIMKRIAADHPTPSAAPGQPSGPSGRGNAVYVIRPDGLVETRFRRPVTILAMLRSNGRLYLGTGNGGVVYSVSPDGDEIAPIADTDAKQVTALAFGEGGEIFFGTANKGSVGRIASDFAPSGTLTSDVLDAKQLAQWGTISVRTEAPVGTKVTVETRSGNVKEPDDATWSSWSKAQPAGGFLSIGSPAGRFLQYRLTLTAEGKVSPAVQQVRLIYQVANLPPAVSALTVKATAKGAGRSGGGSAKAFREVAVKAKDPNGDKLTYTVEFREIGTAGWIEIAKDLKQPKYTWDTRTVADGAYKLRVFASDSPANPPGSALKAGRISDPVVVDNTAPVVEDLGVAPPAGKIVVSGAARDASSRIVSLHYSVDSQDKWTALSARDGICDSDSESFRFELTDLEDGPHRITVKVEDLYGNVGYASVSVTVSK